ncbi:hypothetical protein D3C73_1322860 [compost metagenome]
MDERSWKKPAKRAGLNLRRQIHLQVARWTGNVFCYSSVLGKQDAYGLPQPLLLRLPTRPGSPAGYRRRTARTVHRAHCPGRNRLGHAVVLHPLPHPDPLPDLRCALVLCLHQGPAPGQPGNACGHGQPQLAALGRRSPYRPRVGKLCGVARHAQARAHALPCQ